MSNNGTNETWNDQDYIKISIKHWSKKLSIKLCTIQCKRLIKTHQSQNANNKMKFKHFIINTKYVQSNKIKSYGKNQFLLKISKQNVGGI